MEVSNWIFKRGLVQDITSKNIIRQKIANKEGIYVGFDMTKPSLQLGNLVTLNVADFFSKNGLDSYIVLGGATTLIGDPSGKSNERNISDMKDVNDNLTKIKEYLNKHFPNLKVVNNRDWWVNMSAIEFLRLGKTIGINYLLDRQLIRERLKTTGISYTEFSYTMIQGLDFHHLAHNLNVTMQFGGSDQWGNLLTGHDILSKEGKISSACFSIPLLVDEQGRKFGKTEGNAIFIDENETSNYSLYQSLLNQPDNMLKKLFSSLTTLSVEEIETICKNHEEKKHLRNGQKELAKNIMTRIRDNDAYNKAKTLSESLFSFKYETFNKKDWKDLERSNIFKGTFSNMELDKLVNEIELANSLSEARRLFKNNGIKINNKIVNSSNMTIKDFTIPYLDKYYVISKGKKTLVLIKIKY